MRFRGYAYRAHKPLRAWNDPLSGEGARRRGGRFNRLGMPAFYTALSLFGAIRETSQPFFPIQPVLLCSYEVDAEPVFDAMDVAAMAALQTPVADVDSPGWERQMLDGGIPASPALAERLIAQGYVGMLAPSFARSAQPDDRNLVLWKWGDSLPSRVRLVDEEGRLAPGRNSD